MAELVIERGPQQQGACLSLGIGRHSAGSAATNDIVLLDPALAATHFLIEVTEDAVLIEPDGGPLIAGRRVLGPGAAPASFGRSVRFQAGETDFLLSLPEEPVRARPRRHLLGVPVLAVGILLFSQATAPASVKLRLPDLVAAEAAPASLPPPDVMGELRTRLGGSHLDGVSPGLSPDGSVSLSGTVAPAQEPALRDVRQWFDGAFGARVMLLDSVRVASEPSPLSVRAAWTGRDPYVIDGAGQRLLLGARLASGWVVTAIAADTVTLQRAGRTLAVRF